MWDVGETGYDSSFKASIEDPVQKTQPLNKMNAVHYLRPCFYNIHFNIIIPVDAWRFLKEVRYNV
jgi:hypothetical protein